MTEQQYLDERVLDQIAWYERKAAFSKKWFIRLKILETVLALMIPFLSGCITNENSFSLKVVIGLVGIVVAAVANLMTILKLHENWIQYRMVTESLKQERYLFITKSGPYENGTFASFVSRIESLISKENAQWTSYIVFREKAAEHGAQAAENKSAGRNAKF